MAEELIERARGLFGFADLPPVVASLAENEAVFRDVLASLEKTLFRDGDLSATRRLLAARAAAVHAGADRLDALLAAAPAFASVAPEADADRADLETLLAANAGYNTLYKFRGLTGGRFDQFPLRLSIRGFRATRFDRGTVELLAVVLSSLNACGPCVAAHVKKAKAEDVSYEEVDAAMQVSAAVAVAAAYLAARG